MFGLFHACFFIIVKTDLNVIAVNSRSYSARWNNSGNMHCSLQEEQTSYGFDVLSYKRR